MYDTQILYKIIKDNDIDALHDVPINILQRHAHHMCNYIKEHEIKGITKVMSYIESITGISNAGTHDLDYIKYRVMRSYHFNYYEILGNAINGHHDDTVEFIRSRDTTVYETFIGRMLEVVKGYPKRTVKEYTLGNYINAVNSMCKNYGYTTEVIKYFVDIPNENYVYFDMQSEQLINDTLKEIDGPTYTNLVYHVIHYCSNTKMVRRILLNNYDDIIIKCDLYVNRSMVYQTKKVTDDMINMHPNIIYRVTDYMSRRQVRLWRSIDPNYADFLASDYVYWAKQQLIDAQTI